MNNPKFNIGDAVIIVSDDGVISDNDHHVLSRAFWDYGQSIHDDEVSKNFWVYMVTNDPNKNRLCPWHEKTLRPKPKGNGKTLTEFMNEIKNTKHKEPATA